MSPETVRRFREIDLTPWLIAIGVAGFVTSRLDEG